MKRNVPALSICSRYDMFIATAPFCTRACIQSHIFSLRCWSSIATSVSTSENGRWGDPDLW